MATINSGRWKIFLNDTQFTIYRITASDEGTYKCIGSNSKGSNTHIFQLLVEGQKYSSKTNFWDIMVFMYLLKPVLELKVNSLMLAGS